MRALGPIADEQDSRRRDPGNEARQRAHEEIEALDRDEAAEADDDDLAGIETEPLSRQGPRRRRRAELSGRHTARHRDVLSGSADAARQMLRAAAVGQRDDAVGPARAP